MGPKKKTIVDVDEILSNVESKLASKGIHIDLTGAIDMVEERQDADGDKKIKIVCVTPDLKTSKEEMAGASRDQVVMVRVDETTREALDAWVETGAARSRSEAAALFIREGLKVRKAELDELREALDGVDKARENLRKKAQEVLGDGP